MNSKVAGEDLFNKMDTAKPVEKGVKLLQAYLSSPAIYKAEKLQKYFKSNKAEFLRLLAYYPQVILPPFHFNWLKISLNVA